MRRPGQRCRAGVGIYTCIDDRGTTARLLTARSPNAATTSSGCSAGRVAASASCRPRCTAEERADREAHARKETEAGPPTAMPCGARSQSEGPLSQRSGAQPRLASPRWKPCVRSMRAFGAARQRTPRPSASRCRTRGRLLPRPATAVAPEAATRGQRDIGGGAARSLMQTQESELLRVNRIYDLELRAPAQVVEGRPAGLDQLWYRRQWRKASHAEDRHVGDARCWPGGTGASIALAAASARSAPGDLPAAARTRGQDRLHAAQGAAAHARRRTTRCSA